MLRLYGAIFLLICSLLFLSPIKAQETTATEPVTLQLKYQHNFQFAGYYAAKSKGFYRQAGLDVTINAANIGHSASDAILSGEANYAIGTSNLLIKHSRGLPLVTLAVIFQHSPFILLTNKYTSLADLKGQKTAIYKNAHDLIAMLESQGVHASDYQNNKHAVGLEAFTNADVKAISVYSSNEPYLLKHTGAQFNAFVPRDYGINFYGDNIFTSQRELEQHPQRTQRFIEASIKGWEYALAHQQEIAQLMISQYHSKESLAQILFSAKEIEKLIDPQLLEIGNSSEKRWRHIADIYTALGLLPADYDISSFLYQKNTNSTQPLMVYTATILLAATMVIVLLYRVFTLMRERRRASHQMRFMNSILRTQQQASIDGILTFDANGELVSSNKQLAQLWGLEQTLLDTSDARKIVRQMIGLLKEPREFLNVLRQHKNDPSLRSFAEMTLRDGRTFERFSAPLFHDNKSLLGRFWSFRDITERKVAEEQIWLKANFDSLTELPNRFMFKEHLSFEIKKSRRTSKLLALFFLDIDHFKEINDSMGHDIGDQLLIQVSQRLKDSVRDTDMVSRLGGDEFTVILNDLENISDVERIASKILTAISKPFDIGHQTMYISTSIGITFSPNDGDSDQQLLKNADLAMYQAKNLGRNNYQYFNPALQTNALAKLALSNDLRQALSNHELFLVYQPIVCLNSKKLIKAEALIRWRHPSHGLISPVDFIPIAEETGLINDIGEWVFQQAALQVKAWREINPLFQVSVNTSPVQYQSGNITPRRWHDFLAKHGINDHAVIIELTETLLLESDEALLDILAEFRAFGTPISLDDFGTGYSSLSYLKKFEIDFLKIDRSFVNDLITDPRDATLCQTIITMANSLGMKVIAEGIETDGQECLLNDMGCDFGQGYLFSRPVSAEQINELIQQKVPS